MYFLKVLSVFFLYQIFCHWVVLYYASKSNFSTVIHHIILEGFFLTPYLNVVFLTGGLIELWTLHILLNCLPSLTSPFVYICTLPCLPKCMLNYFDIRLLSYNMLYISFNSIKHSFRHLTMYAEFYLSLFCLTEKQTSVK